MPDVRELQPGETMRAARALLELRPHLGSAEALAARVDDVQRAEGYRVIGSFDEGAEEASAAAGFRVVRMLAWGHALYLDDFVTLPEARRRGHAHALFAWLDDEMQRLGCEQFHLDSAVIAEREDAHRFYFNHGMRISSYHFQRGVRRSG